MLKKLFIILGLLAILLYLSGGQLDFNKQSWSYGGPKVFGFDTGSLDITMHNYIWHNGTPFVRIYDIRSNLPGLAISKSFHHSELAEFLQNLPPVLKDALASRVSLPPLYPFEQ
jgi:hypothetical protein